MRRAIIAYIQYHLPERVLTNDMLAKEFPEWGAEKIAEKTGIHARHIAADGELSSDLATAAARKLFTTGVAAPGDIDYLLFCTQTPDFALPTSACLIQHRLGLPTTAGALDFNLGCSGYVYGLSLAKGLIESGQASRILLLTGETYSKLLDPNDKTVRTIFGDAGTATLVIAREDCDGECVGTFAFGTNGAGGENLVCHTGGLRGPVAEALGRQALWMNGPEIFNFTLSSVPDVVGRVLAQAGLRMEDIDLFVFHQANRYMLDYLRKKMKIPEEKFMVALRDFGNTVSNTIPIALCEAVAQNRLKPGSRILICGFGVGYSWGTGIVTWASAPRIASMS